MRLEVPVFMANSPAKDDIGGQLKEKKMKFDAIISRLKPWRNGRRPAQDITQNWGIRDWADLPVHHPRG